MISYEKHEGYGRIAMASPPVNAIGKQFVADFHAVLDKVDADGPMSALVIESRQRTFCAGADLALVASYFEKPDGPLEMLDYVRSLHTLFNRIEALPMVTIAAVNGVALGGGLELALSCDLRVIKESASVGLPEAKVGMIPGAGGTQRLTRLCGEGIAKRIILAGDLAKGQQAVEFGIAQYWASDDEFDARVTALAEQVAGLSAGALRWSKFCIAGAVDPAVDGFARELAVPLDIMRTQEARERVTAFFNRKS